MPVFHGYVDPIADDPASAAAGKVLPSHWNAEHAVALDLRSFDDDDVIILLS